MPLSPASHAPRCAPVRRTPTVGRIGRKFVRRKVCWADMGLVLLPLHSLPRRLRSASRADRLLRDAWLGGRARSFARSKCCHLRQPMKPAGSFSPPASCCSLSSTRTASSARARAASRPQRRAGSGLLPYQVLFRDLPSARAARVPRHAGRGRRGGAAARATAAAGRRVEQLAADGVPPFAPDVLDKSGLRWSGRVRRAVRQLRRRARRAAPQRRRF